jgi:hypothetical protein
MRHCWRYREGERVVPVQVLRSAAEVVVLQLLDCCRNLLELMLRRMDRRVHEGLVGKTRNRSCGRTMALN